MSGLAARLADEGWDQFIRAFVADVYGDLRRFQDAEGPGAFLTARVTVTPISVAGDNQARELGLPITEVTRDSIVGTCRLVCRSDTATFGLTAEFWSYESQRDYQENGDCTRLAHWSVEIPRDLTADLRARTT